jgi:hypothetical protein
MGIYTRPLATASRLIKKFGQIVVISSSSQTGYNTSTGRAILTTTSQSSFGCIFEWGADNYPNNGEGYIDSSLIEVGDKKLLLSVNGITLPKLGDVATIGGLVYTIVNPIKIVSPSGVPIIVQCNIRA